MTEQEDRPQADPVVSDGSGEATVDLALQVANVAAQVSAARRSADEAKCDELAARLALAQARLQEQQSTPEGLVPFLGVMRGLLSGDDVSALVDDLPAAYRAVYEQLVSEAQADEDEGMLTVREVMDEVTNHVILALARGTFEQRRQIADTLLVMEQESRTRPDLAGLRDLLQAARLLLMGADPTAIAERLTGPFKARWGEILEAIAE